MDNRNALMLSQVSPMNALSQAKNIFVHGDFDKFHAQQKSYEETLEKLDKLGFIAEIAEKEHFFFEDITLINAYKI